MAPAQLLPTADALPNAAARDVPTNPILPLPPTPPMPLAVLRGGATCTMRTCTWVVPLLLAAIASCCASPQARCAGQRGPLPWSGRLRCAALRPRTDAAHPAATDPPYRPAGLRQAQPGVPAGGSNCKQRGGATRQVSTTSVLAHKLQDLGQVQRPWHAGKASLPAAPHWLQVSLHGAAEGQADRHALLWWCVPMGGWGWGNPGPCRPWLLPAAWPPHLCLMAPVPVHLTSTPVAPRAHATVAPGTLIHPQVVMTAAHVSGGCN